MDANRCACIKRFAVTLVPPFPRGLSYTCSFAFLAAHARIKTRGRSAIVHRGRSLVVRFRVARVESPFGGARLGADFADFYGDWQHCVRPAMANDSKATREGLLWLSSGKRTERNAEREKKKSKRKRERGREIEMSTRPAERSRFLFRGAIAIAKIRAGEHSEKQGQLRRSDARSR